MGGSIPASNIQSLYFGCDMSGFNDELDMEEYQLKCAPLTACTNYFRQKYQI